MRVWTLLALLAAAGCDKLTQSCTEIGCGAPFRVSFDKTSPWRPGTYRVEVKADGVTSACEATLPFGGCAIAIPCEGDKQWIFGLSGCALPADSHSISDVSFSTTRPAAVTVSVFHDGRPIGTGSFSPAYVVSRPNGKDCDPECRTAPAASLSLE